MQLKQFFGQLVKSVLSGTLKQQQKDGVLNTVVRLASAPAYTLPLHSENPH